MDTTSFGEIIDFLLSEVSRLTKALEEGGPILDSAAAEIERLTAIEISYRALEKRFIEKCERDNNRWQGDKDAE